MDQRIQNLYAERASDFDSVFGLKLNLSLVVKENEQIYLKKRCELPEPTLVEVEKSNMLRTTGSLAAADCTDESKEPKVEISNQQDEA